MRILQIIDDGEPGAAQRLAGMIAEALAARRFAVETAYLYPRPGLPALTKLVCVLRMARRVWHGGFDAVVAYQPAAAMLAGVVGAIAGCRLRVVHQTRPQTETPRLLRLIDNVVGTLGGYTANIVNSAAAWLEFAGYPKRYRRAMILIEHGLDKPAPRRTRETARRLFDLPPAAPLILNVGRLTEQKNQEVLVRALACLPQAHLVVAGAGPRAEAFMTLAATLGVDDRLHRLGAVSADEIAALHAAADLFALPSTSENFGLAAIEAAMGGLPMVVADLAVLREVLRADGTEPTMFVAPHDTEGWISAIAKALAAPPAPHRLEAFARALGRKFSKQRMIESYLSLFEAYRRSEPIAVADLHAASQHPQGGYGRPIDKTAS